MRQKLVRHFILAPTLWLLHGQGSILLADKGRLTSQPPLRATEEREDYQQCLAAVIKKDKGFEQDEAQKARTKRAIASCRDRYPAVSVLIDCKREMTQAYGDNPQDLKAALQQCRTDYQKLSFDAKDELPFTFHDQLIFFAGAGMNHSVLLREKEDDKQPDALYMGENFGNFSCTPLLESMFERRSAEYLLFGADLQTYTALKHVDRNKLKDAFTWTPMPKNPGTFQPVLDRTMGELYWNPADGNVTNYFPSAFCFYNRRLNTPYEAIKIYYLLDRKVRQATPYFGIAFFRPQKGPQAQELAQKIQEALGKSYQVSQPKPDAFLVSAGPTPQLDSENDPKNICTSDPKPTVMAVVHRPIKDTLADYMILANVGNLCRFGDRMASRFLKNGLKSAP